MAKIRHKDFPNCWEFQSAEEGACGTCPAYPHYGRQCWKITGTKCAGGRFIKSMPNEKILHCRNECDYYRTFLKTFYP